ncbi:MAG: hypothetical protein ACN4GW_01190 [Desulforhopalus sp.]
MKDASFADWNKIRSASESRYFEKVEKAAGTNDVKICLQATMQWLDQISTNRLPARIDLFLHQYGDDGAEDALNEMLKAHGANNAASQTTQFIKVLVKARARWRKAMRRKKNAELLLPEIGLSIR